MQLTSSVSTLLPEVLLELYESTAGASILRREWSVNKQTSCKLEFQVGQDKRCVEKSTR